MIKLFRNIRKKLLSQNRFTQYLAYAIGEIVLVVIGILIALQINNWNENRKERFIEQKILQAINNDLKTDIVAINRMLETEAAAVASNQQLITILKDSASNYLPEYSKKFKDINRYDLFFPKKMGYRALMSKGLEIIQNDNLKSQIVFLYDFEYATTAEMMDLKKQMFLDSNVVFNAFLETLEDGSRIPNNFNEIKNSALFLNHLTHITAEKTIFINFSRATLKVMENTNTTIEKELLQ
ncbi:DUF6090 family protein [Arenibacter sp. GZD96]|uniref:DUF6090 family protein n=1 Tax=Aurantibrevibacter litoralis TaxID=3106030 RepID=UPI002B00355D|nr:DUF6090 family protein [Arenibacter sp. GZD-96]MEA1786065.1 DUF6090 family protein [Arenibacter sp. GZD-96]